MYCRYCKQEFVSMRRGSGRGRLPVYCDKCRSKYSRSTLYRQATRREGPQPLSKNAPLQVYPQSKATQELIKRFVTDVETEAIQPTIEIINNNHWKERVTLKVPAASAKIHGVCDHVFRYAEAKIHVYLDKELIRVIEVSVGGNGWTLKTAAPD